ncbi:MAG: hypothetical protein HYZ26_03445 [Chloroflexi bacterium]|nr:hypothetical protein [Chloroflexota bacterium]
MGSATNDNDLPDWLKELGPSGAGEAPAPQPADEGQPDWLSAEPPAAADSGVFGVEPEEEAVPDWLADIRQAEGRAPDEAPPVLVPPSPEPSEESPGWLEPIRTRESGSLPAEDLEAPGDFMDRIQGMKGGEAGEEDASADWLSGLGQPQPPAESGLFGEESGSLAADWLSGLQGGPAREPAAESLDWLQDVGKSIGLGAPDEAQPGAPAWLGDAEDQPPAEAAPPVPDWAAQAAEQAGQAVAEEFPGLPGEPAGTVPSWLADIAPTEGESESATSAADYKEAASEVFKIDTGELPDWLAQISPEDALPAPPEEEAPRPSPFDVAGELAPADLPDWLQAMRPVATVGPTELPEEDRSEAERVGPLAGLAGVLPAEPEIVQFGRPPSMAAGLQLNETQRGYALRLGEMVAAETAQQARPRPPLALPQRFVRAALALILILAVAVPQLLRGKYTSLPQAAGTRPPAEIQAVLDVAAGLTPEDTVLVALDYQPGLAGEVETAAAGVIDHMIIRGARLALFSTLPTGLGQAEHFMATTQRAEHPDYLRGRDYYNLGYLSGGAAGLLQLATDPRAALPVALPDGSSVWSQPALAAIFRLRDFAALLVLTDDPDSARAWVEQVQPSLVDPISGQTTPLLVVASAQAEPLLYPYWQNEPAQINGLVAGLRGGAFYEANIRELRARRYWDAYSAGLTVAVATLLVGAALGLSRNLLVRRRAGGAA